MWPFRRWSANFAVSAAVSLGRRPVDVFLAMPRCCLALRDGRRKEEPQPCDRGSLACLRVQPDPAPLSLSGHRLAHTPKAVYAAA